jgi:hypothetical protein
LIGFPSTNCPVGRIHVFSDDLAGDQRDAQVHARDVRVVNHERLLDAASDGEDLGADLEASSGTDPSRTTR